MNVVNQMLSDVHNQQSRTINATVDSNIKQFLFRWGIPTATLLSIAILILCALIWVTLQVPVEKPIFKVAGFSKPVPMPSSSIRQSSSTPDINTVDQKLFENIFQEPPQTLQVTNQAKQPETANKKCQSSRSGLVSIKQKSTVPSHIVEITQKPTFNIKPDNLKNVLKNTKTITKLISDNRQTKQSSNPGKKQSVITSVPKKSKETENNAQNRKTSIVNSTDVLKKHNVKKPNNTLTKQKIAFSEAEQSEKKYADAISLLSRGEIIKAEKSLIKLLSHDPTYVSGRKALAGMYINNGELLKAEKILNTGIKTNTKNQIFYQWLGRIYMEQQRFDDAVKLLIAGKKYSDSGEYYAMLALAQQNTTGFKNAITSYQDALRYKPSESKWWLGLGIVLEKNAQWEAAVAAYKSAIHSEKLSQYLHNQALVRIKYVSEQILINSQNAAK